MFSSEVERTISCLNVLFHADPFFSKRGTFPVHNPDELLLACADGILLLRLALLISPGVINPTRIYHNVDLTPFRNRIVLRAQRGADPTPAGINQITQNFDLLAAALARIPAFSNVRVAPSDVLSLNHAAVFSAASELLRGALVSRVSLLHHPCLVKLVREGESVEELMRLGTADLMGRWITYHLGQEEGEEGEETLLVPSVLPRLISKVAPEASAAAASSPLEALRQLGCAVAVTEEELSEGSEGAVALAVAALLDRCPGIEFPSLEEFYVCEEQIRLLRVKVYELECQVDLSYTRDEMFEEINAAIEAKAAEREALEQRVQELSAHTRLMRETAAEYRQREASLSQRVGEERSQAEQEQKELADNKGAIVEDKIREINSEAEAKLAERDEVLRQLEEEIARDEAALAAEKKKKRPSEQELAKLRSSLKQLQDDMAAAETPAGKQPGETSEKRSAQLAAELEQNKATLTKAEQTIRELEQAVARLQADVTAAKQPLLAPKKKGSSTSNSSSDNRSGSKGLRDEFKMSKETIKEVAKCMSQTLSPSASTTATAAAATTAAPSNRKGHNGKAAAQLALVAQALLEVKADMDAQAARVEGQLDKNLEMEELLQVKMDQLAKVQKSKRRMFYFF